MIRRLGWVVLTLFLVPVLLLAVTAVIPGTWLARPVAAVASDYLGANVDIGSVDMHPFSLSPALVVNDIVVSDAPGTASLSVQQAAVRLDLQSLFDSQLVFDLLRLSDGEIDARIDESGRGNWQYLTGHDERQPFTEQQVRTAPLSLPLINTLAIDNLGVRLDNDQTDTEFVLRVNAAASTNQPDRLSSMQIDGTANAQQVTGTLEFSYLGDVLTGLATDDTPVALQAIATIGGSELSVQGSIGKPASLKSLDITFTALLDDIGDLQPFSPVAFPLLPPLSLSGDILREGEEWILRRFDGTLGDSDVQGDVRVDPTTEPVTLYANLISRTLDLDDVAGLIGLRPNPDEQIGVKLSETGKASLTTKGLLPNQPVAARALTRLFNGAINFRADEVLSPVWPVDEIDVRAEINGPRLSLDVNRVGIAGGQVDGNVLIDTRSAANATELALNIKRVELARVLSAAGLTDAGAGAGLLAGRMKFWMTGNSISEMAASADGGVFLLMTGGKLDALLVELIGIDLTESLIVLLDQGDAMETPVNCAFADLQSRAGVMDVATLVFDTEDTVILGDGNIDWQEESLELIIEPHPKDASLLAASTSVSISGKLSNPEIRPQRTLLTRLAAAAVLATTMTPAASLLPFLDTGTGDDSVYCQGMTSALDEAR